MKQKPEQANYFILNYSVSSQLNSINFKFMIRILELPSINRNTQIQVYAQDTNLLTFNTMPDEDYLESLVKETIEALFAYQKQKKF